MNQINVQDKQVITTQTIKSVQIDSVEVKLNESATFVVRLLNENSNLISVEVIKMTGADYENWGSDDNYVTNYILNYLNLIPA